MNVLFEEEGTFRAGGVLADNNTSLQVELPSGKRSKVKTANVLLRFDQIAPGELIASAEVEADKLYVEGTQAGEFHRTVSRLIEMRTRDYLSEAHRTM